MKSLWGKYQNLKLRNKLIISYILIAFIPLCMFSVVIGVGILPQTRESAGLHTQQMAYQTSESLDIYIGTIEKMMDYEVENILSIMADAGTADGRLQERNALKTAMNRQLDNIFQAYPEIAGIMVAFENDTYYSSGMTRNSRDPFIEETWYQTAIAKDGELGIVSTAVGRNIISNSNYSADTIFTLVKKIPATDSTCEGVFLIDIRHDIIEQLINRVSIGERGFLYVIDSRGDMVYAPANEVVYRIDETAFEQEHIKIAGKGYFVSNYVSEYTNWRSVGVIPEQEYLENTYSMALAMLITVVACFGLVTVVTYFISNSITKPISHLQRLMAKVEEGDFSIRFKRSYDDEIGKLGGSFNHMLERIEDLILQLSDEKQSKLKAELKSLQEQFKPHFLYNTLDTIAWTARAYRATEVVRMLEALTTLFRVGLSGGRDYITVKEEKQHVSNYLFIQEIRYKDKLKYEIDIPETLDNMKVPKLILQPLAENAIYHGLKLKRDGGSIFIRGYEDEDSLWFEVEDSGIGVPKEKLQILREQLASEAPLETKSGFGLFYIAERIRLCYGAPYCVTIDSVEGEKTIIKVRLPKENYIGGQADV